MRVTSTAYLNKRATTKQSERQPGESDVWRRGYAAPRGVVLAWILGEGFVDIPVAFDNFEALASNLKDKLLPVLDSKWEDILDMEELQMTEEVRVLDAEIWQYQAALDMKEPDLQYLSGFREALLKGMKVQKPIAEAMSQVQGHEAPMVSFRSANQAYQICGLYALGANYVWDEINEANWDKYAALVKSPANEPGITPLAILRRTDVDLGLSCVRPPRLEGSMQWERFAGVQHATPTRNLRADGGILVGARPNFLVDQQHLAVDDPDRYASPPRPYEEGYRPYTFGVGVYFWPPSKDLSGNVVRNQSAQTSSLLSCIVQGTTWRVFKPDFPAFNSRHSLIEGGALELASRRGQYLWWVSSHKPDKPNKEFANLLAELVRAHDIRAWIKLKSSSQWHWEIDESATDPFLFVVRPSAVESCVEVEKPRHRTRAEAA